MGYDFSVSPSPVPWRPFGISFAFPWHVSERHGAMREPQSPRALSSALVRFATGEATPPSGGASRSVFSDALVEVGWFPLMHARELVDLAAIVSVHGPTLIYQAGSVWETSIDQYWAASKCRLDRWGRTLKHLATQTGQAGPGSGQLDSSLIRGVVEEILTGEVLTRVWTAVMCGYDRHRGTDRMEPVVRSVMIGHLEARHRVLTLLVGEPGIDTEQVVKLNRLRRSTERWADMLVGYLGGLYGTDEFAIDPERAAEFAEDLSYRSRLKGGRHAWPLIQASLRAGFARGLTADSPNADLNHKIAVSILACFPPELFDGTGVFRSVWLTRLTNATSDAQGLIDDLIVSSETSAGDNMLTAIERLSGRLGPSGK